MDGRHISATFTLVALATLWCLAALNGFQPAMVGLSLLLSLEIALFTPLERQLCADRVEHRHAGKVWRR